MSNSCDDLCRCFFKGNDNVNPDMKHHFPMIKKLKMFNIKHEELISDRFVGMFGMVDHLYVFDMYTLTCFRVCHFQPNNGVVLGRSEPSDVDDGHPARGLNVFLFILLKVSAYLLCDQLSLSTE